MSDFRGVRIRIFAVLGSDRHIFQRIGTKFPTELKLSNADFVLSGKWDQKYKSDFRDVQIPVSVSALDRPAFDRTQLCLFYLLHLRSVFSFNGQESTPGYISKRRGTQHTRTLKLVLGRVGQSRQQSRTERSSRPAGLWCSRRAPALRLLCSIRLRSSST